MICVHSYRLVVLEIGDEKTKEKKKLDPVVSTVPYEMMKLCAGSV